MKTTYEIGTTVLASDAFNLPNVLQSAYDAKIRPRCLCRSGAIDMYIARLEDRHIIKRMPGTGASHDSQCEHFDPPPNLSGLGDVMGKAIREEPDGNTALKLQFSLTKLGKRASPAMGEGKADSVKSEGSKLTMLGLLHYLWHEAELTRLMPHYVGRRSWPFVRARLRDAMASKTAKSDALLERVYIPEPWIRDDAQAIDARRKAFLARFRPTNGKSDLFLYVGEVKALEPARFGSMFVIKHAANFPLFLDSKMAQQIEKKFALELALAQTDERNHLMMIATASLNEAQSAQLQEISLMVTNTNWIPFESADEMSLIHALTAEGRAFVKCQRFNVRDRPIASALLVDTKPATAMYIVPDDATDEHRSIIDGLSGETAMPTWLWDASEPEWPAFPKKASNAG